MQEKIEQLESNVVLILEHLSRVRYDHRARLRAQPDAWPYNVALGHSRGSLSHDTVGGLAHDTGGLCHMTM